MTEPLKRIYYGLSAAAYDTLLPRGISDAGLYRRAVETGQPALEIASGTGRLLIEFAAAGLDVEGVDLSPDMIASCRRKAARRRLEVTVHQQDMRALDLARRYRTIYIPIYSFQHLIDLAEIRRTLRRFFDHLEPGGRLLISLLVPWKHDFHIEPAVPGRWRLRREGTDEDGSWLGCWELLTREEGRVRWTEYRFERWVEDRIVEREHFREAMRWYTQEEFRDLLLEAGFSAVREMTAEGDPVEPEAPSWISEAVR